MNTGRLTMSTGSIRFPCFAAVRTEHSGCPGGLRAESVETTSLAVSTGWQTIGPTGFYSAALLSGAFAQSLQPFLMFAFLETYPTEQIGLWLLCAHYKDPLCMIVIKVCLYGAYCQC